MAQEAASGRLTRDLDNEARSIKDADNRRGRDTMPVNSFIEASKVSSMFGLKLGKQMNAYTGDPNDFGCPGNMVDHWRGQFTGGEAGLKAANAKAGRHSS
ncbi:MAG: hypothetical protein ACRBM6_11610 [Geminicoccales bacterium]